MPKKNPPNVTARKAVSKTPPAKRSRLSPDARRSQIVDAAARMIVEQGHLPLAIENLANSLGISKALIYAYFPDQYALCNHLFEREITGLLVGGLDIASQVPDLEQSMLLCSMLYFEHVAHYGALLNILMTDRYMTGHIERRLLRMCNRVLRRLAHKAERQLKLNKQEALAAVEMMIAIPEETGRLAFVQTLDPLIAQQVCRQLISSSLRGLRDPDRSLAIAVTGK